MTKSDKFEFTTGWGMVVKGCHFEVAKYGNGNKALQVYAPEEGCDYCVPYCTCSVNGERINAEDEIGIKDYSENEGMVAFLRKIGIIDRLVAIERSGWVQIPYFKLTTSGMELFK